MYTLDDFTYWHNEIKNITKTRFDLAPNFSKLSTIQLADYKTKKIELRSDIIDMVAEFENDSIKDMYIASKSLLELCKLRNKLAKESGYESYQHLLLESQGFNLIHVKSIKGILNRIPSKSFKDIQSFYKLDNIENYWSSYYIKLQECTGDHKYSDSDYYDFSKKLLIQLGLESVASLIKIVIKKQNYATGMAFNLSNEYDKSAGILLRPGNCSSFFTLAHEIGHAILYIKSINELGSLPPWLNESFAVTVENSAYARNLINDYVDNDKINQLHLLRDQHKLTELNRLQCLLDFEDYLWKLTSDLSFNVDKTIIKLDRYYETAAFKYLGAKVKTNLSWAFNSFFSIDPVYNQSYIMAQDNVKNISNETIYISENYIKENLTRIL